MALIIGTNGNDTYYGGAAGDTYILAGGNDFVRPAGGDDSVNGGAGSDWISYFGSSVGVFVNQETGIGLLGDAQGDTWTNVEKISGSSSGNNIFVGGSQDSTFIGYSGDDQFKGAGGADSFEGGAGRDSVSYENSDAGVTIEPSFGLGGDAAGDTYSGIERFRGSDYDDLFLGSTGNDDFEGRDGDDTFKGSAGADSFVGGDGLDVIDYSGSPSAVTILTGAVGAGGDAEGYSYASIEGGRGSAYNDSLAGNDDANQLEGQGGDDFIKGGGGADTLLGGNGDDSLQGQDGADFLGGGAGADVMAGGLGNDFYIVDNVGDVVQGEVAFASGGGIDTVRSFIDYTQPDNVELVRLGNINGTGNLSATGNDAPGTLVGNAGNNTLTGRGGNDQINGNDGNDVMTGNTGVDTLVGGAGFDTFVYTAIADSRAGITERDVINGFVHGEDLIDLSAIDANTTTGFNDAFEFIGNAGFGGGGASDAGQLRTQSLGGPNAVLLEADHNGDGIADFQIFVNLTTFMQTSDFVL